MVSNKKKGYNFEYRIIKYLRMNGYYCIRAYASLGLYDIIAVPPKDRKLAGFPEGTLLIQAKYNGYVDPKERERLNNNRKWDGSDIVVYVGKNNPKRILKVKNIPL